LSKNLSEAKQYVEMEHSIDSLKSSFHNIFLPELISNEILQSEKVYIMTKINRAVKLLTFGNVDESWQLLKQIFQSLPKTSKIIQTVLYILILSGQSEKANELILKIR
jgi:thioredoxin-like negative regulator of GroEL